MEQIHVSISLSPICFSVDTVEISLINKLLSKYVSPAIAMMRKASDMRRQRTAAELLCYICICKLLHTLSLFRQLKGSAN